MNKNKWTRNIKYFLIAIIILVFGYFFGIIILGIIALIIVLMSVLFLISLLFNKSLDFFLNKKVRLFITMFFSLAISYGFIMLFWKSIDSILNVVLKISVIWAITAFIFGSLWNIFVIRKRVVYKNKVFDYKEKDLKIGIQFKDIFFMIIIPLIFSLTFSILKGILII
jgi:hypothetical protein